MLGYMIAGLVTALGILIILVKIGLKRVLYWEVPVDIFFTIAVPLMMMGTYSGLMTAIFAGIGVSLGLRILRSWFKIDAPDMFVRMREKGWIE